MSLAAMFRDAPIRRKLMLIGLLTSGLALLAISLILIVRDIVDWRERTVTELTTYASVIGTNAASALLFDDRKAAAETLAALSAKPDIARVVIFDGNGMEFAAYHAPGHFPSAMPRLQPGRYIFTLDSLVVSKYIVFNNDTLGAIYLESDLKDLYAGIRRDSGLIFVAALGVFLVAAFMFAKLQKAFVSPILDLSRTMQTVSREQNYSVRVVPRGKDEVGMLARTFNAMLDRIQQRDIELAQHRAHLEQEVAQRTARLTEAQRIAHLGNWELDVASNVLAWSDEIYRIFGLTPQQFGATHEAFMQAVHPEDRQFVETKTREALELGRPYSIDHRILLPDGTLRHVHEMAEVLRNEESQAVKMVGTVQDITERKRAEESIRKLNDELEEKVLQRTQQLLDAQEELVRKEKLAVLGQVAGSVGHELRNPLGVMNNAVYFLQTVLSEADETTKEYLNIIKAEIAGSERIVSDLLDAVRTQPPHPEAVGLGELIGQTLRKCSIPPSVTVKLDIPVTLPPLRADALQIHQVLRNLISNGVEAMPAGGALEISAVENKQDGSVTVGVRDSGSGIAPEVMRKLFQPLFTTKPRGIGLGLVVVKNLIEANGGRVDVLSEAGKGATFSITLPMADAGAGSAP